MKKISVLLVDDHTVVRQGLRALLRSEEDIEVVGETVNGAETITQAARLQPDVILMDLQMPDVNGVEATRQILHTSPHIAVLIVTMFEDDDFVDVALVLRGVVGKSEGYAAFFIDPEYEGAVS